MDSTIKFDASNELHVELLVHGYCNLYSPKDVPVEIMDLCLQFYQMDGGITFLAVGQCGKALNLAFHKNILLDKDNKLKNKSHQDNPIVKNSLYFDPKGKARCLLIDTERTVDGYGEQIFGTHGRWHLENQMFNMENNMIGPSGCGNNWAKGFYTQGYELLTSDILPRIRKIMEKKDSGIKNTNTNTNKNENININIDSNTNIGDKQEGFGLIHSVGGGTGSGLGALLLTEIAEEYPKQILYTISVTTTPRVSDVVVEAYNALLTYNKIKDCTDFTFILDNRSLMEISRKVKKNNSPTYSDLNRIALDMINDVSFMFGKRCINNINNNSGNVDNKNVSNSENSRLVRQKGNTLSLSSFSAHMVSNSRLKYLTTVHKGISIDSKKNSVVTDWDRLKYSACDVTNGLNLASVVVNYDDKVKSNNDWSSIISNEFFEVNSKKYHFKNGNNVMFVDGVEDNGSNNGSYMSGSDGISFITNNTSVSQCLNRTLQFFNKMYRRKAFLHWYKGEGMDEDEFLEAQEYMTSVIQSYQDEEKLYNNGSSFKKNATYDK